MNNLHSSLKEINMRTIVLSVILFCCGMSHVTAQSDYIVTTPSTQEIPASEEEQFIIKHFPLKPLCKWTPGMKFMFAPSAREMFLPTLLIYNTEKGVDNSLMRHKILTFTGTEEKVQKIADETNYTTRFVFEDEGEKYYYDIKNMRLDRRPRRSTSATMANTPSGATVPSRMSSLPLPQASRGCCASAPPAPLKTNSNTAIWSRARSPLRKMTSIRSC